MKPIAVDEFCRLKFLSGVTFSPEGRTACLVVSEADRKKNGYRSYLYLRRDGKLKKLTSFGKESSFQYLDEDTILFPGRREEGDKGAIDSRWYRISLSGGEAEEAYAFPIPVSRVLPLPGGDLVVLGAGGSGLVAAVRYAELTGKKVVVLEKLDRLGGSSVTSGGYVYGTGSQMNKDESIDGYHPEDMGAYYNERTGGDMDEAMVTFWAEHSGESVDWLIDEMGVKKIRFPETASIGIKPVSVEGTERLVKAALDYAIANDRKSVTLVHKGNIQKFTEGAFRDWGYALAKRDYGATLIDKGPWCEFKNPKTGRTITVKDCICDAFLQQILTRPAEYDVIATLNLNGDYVSDALAATVGGIGIAPGANINYQTGVAVFEATHGTAPKYANLDKVNPGSLILSGEMMLRYMGWTEAADRIIAAMDKVIAAKTVTYDFARQMEGATEIKCSEFGAALAAAM